MGANKQNKIKHSACIVLSSEKVENAVNCIFLLYYFSSTFASIPTSFESQ